MYARGYDKDDRDRKRLHWLWRGNILVCNRWRLLSTDAGRNVKKIWEDFIIDELGKVVEVINVSGLFW
jgi:hypothetical protein